MNQGPRVCTIARVPESVGGRWGAVAQLVAHHTGSVGVRGSSPLGSTPYEATGMPRPVGRGFCVRATNVPQRHVDQSRSGWLALRASVIIASKASDVR